MTRDKKLLLKVEVEGIERTLVFDTGAVDLVLDPSVVGLKASDLNEKSLLNMNTSLRIAERRVTFRFAGRKFSILAAVLDCRRLSKLAGTKVEGIIGIAVFEQFRKITIDFENARIEVW
jgi:hypothetical protein